MVVATRRELPCPLQRPGRTTEGSPSVTSRRPPTGVSDGRCSPATTRSRPGVFEQAGVRALLVGDTSAEMVLGYPDTLPVTMDQLIPMVQAVVRGTRSALV